MDLLLLAVLLCMIYPSGLFVYRLWFSPISHIPGPLLARATYWYEFYYDVVLQGRYTFKIKEFHDSYGPIIRVNPHEVHIHDPDFFDQIYAGAGKKRNRWEWSAKAFGLPHAMISATDFEDHRQKRLPINPYFSKSKVRNLQPVIDSTIQTLLARFEEYKTTMRPLPLDAAMFAFSNDSIMRYAFGRSYDRIMMEDFEPSFQTASRAAVRSTHMIKHLPIIHSIIRMIPEEKLQKARPDIAGFLRLREDMKRQIVETQRELNAADKIAPAKTIFHELLQEKRSRLTASPPFLWESGIVIVGGATATTATTLSITIFHLLQNQTCLRRLREELSSASAFHTLGDGVNLPTIERLPYLTAVIKEGLRMSGTVTTRLQRIDPTESLLYTDCRTNGRKAYSIPPGIPVSSTVILIHYDPTTYPQPYKFRPERWLEENGNTPPSETHFVPFLKGSMNCVGMNFAWAEMYLLLFHMFRPGSFGGKEARSKGDRGCFELFETDDRDIEVVGDGLGPIYRPDSRGIRILVTP